MRISPNYQSLPDSRLKHFPISFFAIVMGLSGLSIAYKSMDYPAISFAIGSFASLVMLIICGFYLAKMLRYPQEVNHEIHHPVRLNFFPAFSISLLLLSIVWHGESQLSFVLWGAGTAIQFILTLYVMSSWIHHSHYTLSHANPSWFIPVVGNILIPITGTHFGYYELSWFFFSIGLIFWLVLFTIILYRLFFHEPLPQRLTPMLFILLAPPSVGFVSYTALISTVDNAARILYYIALFLGLLLLSNMMRFLRVPFFISSWAYSFPFAALTIATAKMAGFIQSSLLGILSVIFLVTLSFLFIWLIYQTVIAIVKGNICQPES